jgi:GAF domain-containing protein/HAMP domain-containing protein
LNKISAHTPKSMNSFWRLLFALVGFGSATILFSLSLFSQSGVRQALIPPALVLIGVLVAGPFVIYNLRRGQNNLVGIIMIATLAMVYLGNELAWKGLNVYHSVGGCLLIVLSGSFIVPRQWRVWGSFAILYLIAVFLINRFEPFARVESNTITTLLPFTIGINLLFILVMVFQLLLELPTQSIRIRLVGTNLLLVTVPVALTGIVAMWLNAQNSQNAVYRQLEAVASLKESAVRSWMNNLKPDLETVASGLLDVNQVEILLGLSDLQTDDIYQATYTRLERQITNHLENTGLFTEILITDLDGTVVFSTQTASQGISLRSEAFFLKSLEDSIISPPVTKEGQGNIMFAARPIKTQDGQTMAILAGKVNLKPLNAIMVERVGMGNTGETYLVNPSHHLITDSLFEGYQVGVSYIFSFGIDQALYKNETGSGSYSGYRVSPVLGVYRWIPELGVAFIAEQAQSEALGSTYRGLFINFGLMVTAILIALFVGLIAANRITGPLARLSKTAEQIAQGNLQLTAGVEELDEIGALSRSFNSMTAQLRSLVTSLEQRVTDRTRDLERRSTQLRIAAEVAREATTAHDLEELLQRGVDLIHDRFGYYHVGIFLVDDLGRDAVLMAATGEAGRTMLLRGHKLRVGETGIVGHVAQSGKPRISVDVDSDAVHYVNPLLPETRSEAALPLKVGAQVIGVVDVQSKEAGLFDEETISVLQIVTDQLATAIQNTRLIRDLGRNVDELQRMYGVYTQTSWKKFQQRQLQFRGYRYRGLEIEPVGEETGLVQEAIQKGQSVYQFNEMVNTEDQPQENQATLAVPIKVHGQTIGAIQVQLSGQLVNQEILAIYEEIANRLALILENARLLQDAQNLAQREQQINVLSTQIRNSINLDTILQNTVRELGKAFGTSRAFIQIGLGADSEQDGTL